MLAHRLDWDSDFFKCNIALADVNTLTVDSKLELLAYCYAHKIDCLYFLADPSDKYTVDLLEDKWSHLTDVRLTFQRPLETPWPSFESDITITPAVGADMFTLSTLVHFPASRFYYDPHFTTAECDRLYSSWVINSYQGLADEILVARRNGEYAGFVTIKQHDGCVETVLTGVSPDHQGHHIGPLLHLAAWQWGLDYGLKTGMVVTQGRNHAAHKFQNKLGYLLTDVKLWYHLWFKERSCAS